MKKLTPKANPEYAAMMRNSVARKKRVLRLWSEGHSAIHIGALVGLSRQRVSKIVKDNQ